MFDSSILALLSLQLRQFLPILTPMHLGPQVAGLPTTTPSQAAESTFFLRVPQFLDSRCQRCQESRNSTAAVGFSGLTPCPAEGVRQGA